MRWSVVLCAIGLALLGCAEPERVQIPDRLNQMIPLIEQTLAAANLGAVETVIGPPATTSHVECTLEERQAMGIPESLIRYSTGIENVDDLIADLDQALEAV